MVTNHVIFKIFFINTFFKDSYFQTMYTIIYLFLIAYNISM